MDEPSARTRNFVCRDGRSNAAAADRHPPRNLPRGHRPNQGDDEIGVIITGVQLMCAEVHDLVPGAAQRLRNLAL